MCHPQGAVESRVWLLLKWNLLQKTHHVIPLVTQEAPSSNPFGQKVCSCGQTCLSVSQVMRQLCIEVVFL